MWGHKELTTMKDDNRRLEFFTRNELALRWQVSVETLKRRERAGLLPAFKTLLRCNRPALLGGPIVYRPCKAGARF